MNKKNKRKKKKLVIVLILVVLISLSLIGWYLFVGPDYSDLYLGSGKILKNPVSGLSIDEAVMNFDESGIYYLLVALKTYNLHSPPLSSNNPKIEIIVDDDIYSAIIDKGVIKIFKGEIEGEDIVIYTSKVEAVKMLKNLSYVLNSFKNGLLRVELVAGEIELVSKGYLELYKTLTS
jgi:hypothetical protein